MPSDDEGSGDWSKRNFYVSRELTKALRTMQGEVLTLTIGELVTKTGFDAQRISRAVAKSNRKEWKGGGKYFDIEIAEDIRDWKITAKEPSNLRWERPQPQVHRAPPWRIRQLEAFHRALEERKGQEQKVEEDSCEESEEDSWQLPSDERSHEDEKEDDGWREDGWWQGWQEAGPQEDRWKQAVLRRAAEVQEGEELQRILDNRNAEELKAQEHRALEERKAQEQSALEERKAQEHRALEAEAASIQRMLDHRRALEEHRALEAEAASIQRMLDHRRALEEAGAIAAARAHFGAHRG